MCATPGPACHVIYMHHRQRRCTKASGQDWPGGTRTWLHRCPQGTTAMSSLEGTCPSCCGKAVHSGTRSAHAMAASQAGMCGSPARPCGAVRMGSVPGVVGRAGHSVGHGRCVLQAPLLPLARKAHERPCAGSAHQTGSRVGSGVAPAGLPAWHLPGSWHAQIKSISRGLERDWQMGHVLGSC